MRNPPRFISMKELSEIPLQPGRYTRIIPGRHLKYMAPGVDGLGLCSFSLLLPESVLLFVAPAGCARHVKLRACAAGMDRRLFLLRVSEEELVTGSHLERIPEAVAEILERTHPTPKAIFIGSSCVDTILASDYERVCAQLRRTFPQVRFTPNYMDPVMFDSKKSPDNRIHCSLFSFVAKQDERDRGVNLLGPALPLPEDADLIRLLNRQGFGPVRQMCRCQTLCKADQMSRSTLNLAVGPLTMASEQLRARLGIPYLTLPYSHDPDELHQFYERLGQQLGVCIDDGEERRLAAQALRQASEKLRGKRIAIGKNYGANPFNLAKTLLEYGFTVTTVIKNKITPKDKPVIAWLAEQAGDMRVYSGDHPTLNTLRQEHQPVDYVIGSDAEWFFPEAGAVLSDEKHLYLGYQGILYLTEGLCRGRESV